MDTINAQERSANMAKIRSSNTQPELLLRSALFRRGFRFRINSKSLKGHPDIVLPKYNAVIFVNGCFWHGHENCTKFRYPTSNIEYWQAKIKKNRARDQLVYRTLSHDGWRICIVWECCFRGPHEKGSFESKVDEIEKWLKSSRAFFEIRSQNTYRGFIDSKFSVAAEDSPNYNKGGQS